MIRGLAYRRYVRNKSIIRKKRISNQCYGFDWYDFDGQYSKGKIHCGCGMCKPTKRFCYPSLEIVRNNTKIKSEKIYERTLDSN